VNCSGTVTIVQSSTAVVSGGTLTIVPTPNSEGGGAKRDVRGGKALVPGEKRQATKVPTKIPAYASACSGAVRYSSACSCIGAKHTTVTAAAPTKKVTVTIVRYLHFCPDTTMAYIKTKALS
jgi:hypothetical protein